MNYCSTKLFHLSSSCLAKLHLNFKKIKFEFFKITWMVKQPK
jgi:hypothetical protein